MNPTLEFVGTWEEVVAHSAELAGQRVRVTVITQEHPAATDSVQRAPGAVLESAEMLPPYELSRGRGELVRYRDAGPREPDGYMT